MIKLNVDIRKYIKENFKDTTTKEIRESIESSIKEKDEVTLPGLGVLFEILWTNSENDLQEKILDIINNNI